MPSAAMTKLKPMTVPPLLADLEFTIGVPEGFVAPGFPQEQVDFDNPTTLAPLALFSSPVAAAMVTVSARPAYETGSVLQWLRYLTDFHGMQMENVRTGVIGKGGSQKAILADATHPQEDVTLRMFIAAFEDAGRFVMVTGLSATELWASFGDALTESVKTITLARPKGAKHDLDSTTALGWKKEDARTHADYERDLNALKQQLKPVVEFAEGLLQSDRFEDAEKAVMQVDSSIQGGVAIARMYERHLTALVKAGEVKNNKDRVETVFRRALSWAQNCYPEPHTEVEADDYAAGRAEDLKRLTTILGYVPKD